MIHGSEIESNSVFAFLKAHKALTVRKSGVIKKTDSAKTV